MTKTSLTAKERERREDEAFEKVLDETYGHTAADADVFERVGEIALDVLFRKNVVSRAEITAVLHEQLLRTRKAQNPEITFDRKHLVLLSALKKMQSFPDAE